MRIILAAAMTAVVLMPMQDAVKSTCLNGQPVNFVIVQPSGKEKMAGIGPWKLGAKVTESKPHDGRLNLYVVVPGDDFQSNEEAAAIYDHNRVINLAPKEGGPADYDVYWAVALEPHLGRDFQSETELLQAAQRRFLPGDLFSISDAPAASFLREVQHWDSLDDLRGYRRKDGTLPTLLILPAGFAVRGSVQP